MMASARATETAERRSGAGQPAAVAATGDAAARLRVLVFSSLFPSEVRPRHGIFVETRLAHLVNDCPLDARVVAPVPWFPFASPRFGAYAAYAATPRRALRVNGLEVTYPRYWMLPKLGVALQPDSMARGALPDIMQLQRAGWRPDLIDAHYLYPDGVAAAVLAKRLGIPFVMTARGTDVNVLARMTGPGRRIAEAARQAARVITVSGGLKTALVSLGVEPSKVVVLRNGVDLGVFHAEPRAAARSRLGLPAHGLLLLSVGNLVPEKDQVLALEVLHQIGDATLLIVGDGPMRAELSAAARRLGIEARVVLRSAMPQDELRLAYSAANVLLLTSTREGWPNVVLESMACETPVAAVDVGAVREMITDDRVGRIVRGRDPRDLAAAVHRLAIEADPRVLRRHAASFDWATISRGQWDVFNQAMAAARPALRKHD